MRCDAMRIVCSIVRHTSETRRGSALSHVTSIACSTAAHAKWTKETPTIITHRYVEGLAQRGGKETVMLQQHSADRGGIRCHAMHRVMHSNPQSPPHMIAAHGMSVSV